MSDIQYGRVSGGATSSAPSALREEAKGATGAAVPRGTRRSDAVPWWGRRKLTLSHSRVRMYTFNAVN